MQGRLLLITWLAMAGVAQAAPHEHGVPAAEGRAKPAAWSALPLLLPVVGAIPIAVGFLAEVRHFHRLAALALAAQRLDAGDPDHRRRPFAMPHISSDAETTRAAASTTGRGFP